MPSVKGVAYAEGVETAKSRQFWPIAANGLDRPLRGLPVACAGG